MFGPVIEIKSFSNKLKNNSSIQDFVLLQHKNHIIASITSSKNNFQSINSQLFANYKTFEIKGMTYIESFTYTNHIVRVAPINIEKLSNKHECTMKLKIL